jgi:lambda repressor-like predicted transcriptional regulator
MNAGPFLTTQIHTSKLCRKILTYHVFTNWFPKIIDYAIQDKCSSARRVSRRGGNRNTSIAAYMERVLQQKEWLCKDFDI